MPVATLNFGRSGQCESKSLLTEHLLSLSKRMLQQQQIETKNCASELLGNASAWPFGGWIQRNKYTPQILGA